MDVTLSKRRLRSRRDSKPRHSRGHNDSKKKESVSIDGKTMDRGVSIANSAIRKASAFYTPNSKSSSRQRLKDLDSPDLVLQQVKPHLVGEQNRKVSHNGHRDTRETSSSRSIGSSNSSLATASTSRSTNASDPLRMRSMYLEELCPTPISSLGCISIPLWTLSTRGHKQMSIRPRDKELIELLSVEAKSIVLSLIGRLDPIELEELPDPSSFSSCGACFGGLVNLLQTAMNGCIRMKKRPRRLSTIPTETQLDLLRNSNALLCSHGLCITLVRQELQSPGSVILNYYLEVRPLDRVSSHKNEIIVRRVAFNHQHQSDRHEAKLVHEFRAHSGSTKFSITEREGNTTSTNAGSASTEASGYLKPQVSVSQLSLS